MNLALICFACHQAHHEGTLTITGTADRIEVRRHGEASWASEPGAHVGAGGAHDTAPQSDGQPGPRESRAPGPNFSPGVDLPPSAKVGPRIEPSTNRDGAAHVGVRIGPTAEARQGPPMSRPNFDVEPALLDIDAGQEPPTRLEAAIRRSQTKDTLMGLGWKPAIASAAVAAAWAKVGSRATLEQLILEALRQCPRPLARPGGAP